MSRARNKQRKKIRTGIADFCMEGANVMKILPEGTVENAAVADLIEIGKEFLIMQDQWINDLTTALSKSERKYNAIIDMVDHCAEKNSGLRHRIKRLEKLISDMKNPGCSLGETRRLDPPCIDLCGEDGS